jgi:hypothetical protein
MAASGILAGLKLEEDVIYRILRRDIMQESTVYRSIERDARQEEKREIAVSVMNYSRFRSGTFETLAQSQPIFILWEIAKNSRH